MKNEHIEKMIDCWNTLKEDGSQARHKEANQLLDKFQFKFGQKVNIISHIAFGMLR